MSPFCLLATSIKDLPAQTSGQSYVSSPAVREMPLLFTTFSIVLINGWKQGLETVTEFPGRGRRTRICTVRSLVQSFARHLPLSDQPDVTGSGHVELTGRFVHRGSFVLTANRCTVGRNCVFPGCGPASFPNSGHSFQVTDWVCEGLDCPVLRGVEGAGAHLSYLRVTVGCLVSTSGPIEFKQTPHRSHGSRDPDPFGS